MIIVPANTLAAGGFSVDNSCRFNDGDSPQLHRDQPGTPTATTKFTWSGWFKLGSSAAQITLASSFTSGSVYDQIKIMATATHNNVLRIEAGSNEGNAIDLKATQRLRDPGAWYHLVLAVDTTQGTAGNRDKVYLNGTQITDWQTETHSTQNDTWHMNASGKTIKVGVYDNGTPQDFFDGYLAEVVQVDGQQLAPTSFGQFNEDSPTIWEPIDVSGLTFGTNGYYMDFEDSSALGNDVAGKGDFTVANLAATDQAADTPTNNWCVLNPLDKHASATFAEGNLDLSTTASGWYGGSGTMGITLGSGPWYWEAKAISSTRLYFGLSRIGQGVRGTVLDNSVEGSSDFDYMWRTTSANTVFYGGSNQSITIAAISANDICACSVAADGEVIFYVNDSVVVTFSTKLVAGFTYFPVLAANAFGGGTEQWQANFGNPPYANSSSQSDADELGDFEFATKSAYAICTKNLGAYGG